MEGNLFRMINTDRSYTRDQIVKYLQNEKIMGEDLWDTDTKELFLTFLADEKNIFDEDQRRISCTEWSEIINDFEDWLLSASDDDEEEKPALNEYEAVKIAFPGLKDESVDTIGTWYLYEGAAKKFTDLDELANYISGDFMNMFWGGDYDKREFVKVARDMINNGYYEVTEFPYEELQMEFGDVNFAVDPDFDTGYPKLDLGFDMKGRRSQIAYCLNDIGPHYVDKADACKMYIENCGLSQEEAKEKVVKFKDEAPDRRFYNNDKLDQIKLITYFDDVYALDWPLFDIEANRSDEDMDSYCGPKEYIRRLLDDAKNDGIDLTNDQAISNTIEAYDTLIYDTLYGETLSRIEDDLKKYATDSYPHIKRAYATICEWKKELEDVEKGKFTESKLNKGLNNGKATVSIKEGRRAVSIMKQFKKGFEALDKAFATIPSIQNACTEFRFRTGSDDFYGDYVITIGFDKDVVDIQNVYWRLTGDKDRLNWTSNCNREKAVAELINETLEYDDIYLLGNPLEETLYILNATPIEE